MGELTVEVGDVLKGGDGAASGEADALGHFVFLDHRFFLLVRERAA